MSSGYEKKGVPAGTPLVAGHAGICQVSATRSLNTIHREMGFVNPPQLGIWFNVMICTNQLVPTYTNYNHCAKDSKRFIRQKNHYESTILKLSYFKKRYNDFKEKTKVKRNKISYQRKESPTLVLLYRINYLIKSKLLHKWHFTLLHRESESNR